MSLIGPAPDPPRAAPRHRGRAVGRRLLASVLLGISGASFTLAGIAHAGDSLVGSPEKTAATVLGVVTSSSTRFAVASQIVDQLQKDESGAARSVIARHHFELVLAMEAVLVDPTVQQVARHELVVIYDAVSSNRASRIDLRPLLFRFTEAMHVVDPGIAARPAGLHNAVLTVKHLHVPLRAVRWLIPIEVLLVTLGALLAAFATAFFVRGGRRQWWTLGLNFGLPAVELFVASRVVVGVVDHVHFSDADSRTIVRGAARQVAGVIGHSSYFMALLTAVALSSWGVGSFWRTRRIRRRSTSV